MKPSRMASSRAGQHTVTIDAGALDIAQWVDELDAKVEAAIRPAAQAGAQVLYEAVQSNVRAIGKKTGNLYGSIYQAFSPEKSGQDRAEYHISWRTGGTGVRAPHGHLVEYGHWQKYKAYLGKDGNWYTNKKAPLPTPIRVSGKFFIRNAASRSGEALEAAEKRFFEEVKP